MIDAGHVLLWALWCATLVFLGRQLRTVRVLQERELLRILGRGGEWYGLDLVEASEDLVPRSVVYHRLGMLEDLHLVESRLDPAHDSPCLARRLYHLTPLGRDYAERVGGR